MLPRLYFHIASVNVSCRLIKRSALFSNRLTYFLRWLFTFIGEGTDFHADNYILYKPRSRIAIVPLLVPWFLVSKEY